MMTMTATDRPQKFQNIFSAAPGFPARHPYHLSVSQREKNFFERTPFFGQRLRNLSAEDKHNDYILR